MLVKKLLKGYLRWIFGVLALIILGVVIWWIVKGVDEEVFFNPLLKELTKPDLTSELSLKTLTPLQLDYSSSTTSSVLADEIKYLVINTNSGKVYANKGEKEVISPASFTKIMTAQVALDVTKDDPLLLVTEKSLGKEPTILGLKKGEQLRLNDLIRSMMTTSANDSASVVGVGVATIYGQDEGFFVELMNQKAKLLGMNDTHFENTEGYDDPIQHSSLEDMSKLVVNVLTNYPDILEMSKTDREDIQKSSTHGHYYLQNWNGLLNVYPGVTGLKIAYTEKAGYSTIVTAERGKIPVTVLLLGADSIRERDLAAASLLDLAYLTEDIQAVNITSYQLNKKYKVWNDLISKTKKELEELEKKSREVGN